MKKIMMICVMPVTMVVTAFAQKVNYSQYNVIIEKGSLTVVEKDGKYYNMLIGSIKNPKKVIYLGHNKNLAAGRYDRLLEIMENDKISEKGRLEIFCGAQLRVFVKGEGEQRQFTFKDENSNAKFVLTKQDCLELKEIIEK